MRQWIRTWSGLAFLALTLIAAGCGSGDEITISYNRPPKYDIPSSVHKVAIVQFGAKAGTEKKWGEIAADKLAGVMDAYNKKFQRYMLVDRKRVAALMEERDFQMSVSDTNEMVEFGKIARVDAMIYGTVYVTSEDEQLMKTYFDPFTQSLKQRPVIRRYALASVNFTMDDVQTHRTICSVTVTKEYDSEKADKSWTSALGFGGEKLPATDHIINALIEKCIEDFVMKVSPHQVIVDVELMRGGTDYTDQGNTFAKEKEYRDAIRMYKMGIAKKPDDYDTMFNVGVCYEAMGQLDKAYEYYEMALRGKPEPEFIRARRRVRIEGADEGIFDEDTVEENRRRARQRMQNN